MDPSCNRTMAHLLVTTYYCIPLYALPVTEETVGTYWIFPSECYRYGTQASKWFSPKLRSDLRIRLTHSRLSPSLPRSRFPCGATVSIIAFPIIISNQIANTDIVSFFQKVVKECFKASSRILHALLRFAQHAKERILPQLHISRDFGIYNSFVIKLSLFCHSPDFML